MVLSMETLINYIEKLKLTGHLDKDEWVFLIEHRTKEFTEYLFEHARQIRHQHYGCDIYIRGLIEFSNYCKNNCYYCGIRRDNQTLPRYRLSQEEILNCCHIGYKMGFRTFVLQSGEDSHFTDERMVSLIQKIKSFYPDCAITLSVGEKSFDTYQKYFDAGADRYLLRHETYNASHYSKLHPAKLSSANRQQCLWDLKKIGYQTGTGFMVGSPYQTAEHLAEDMLFLEKLQPHMVGIGPFIPHHATPFAKEAAGTLELTLFMLALIRLLLPQVLLPATTALGTIHPNGRELGILAGANVVMPNLSPVNRRKAYALYDNKLSVDAEAAEGKEQLARQMEAIGYHIVTSRGDWLSA